jgi:hypothetical protein
VPSPALYTQNGVKRDFQVTGILMRDVSQMDKPANMKRFTSSMEAFSSYCETRRDRSEVLPFSFGKKEEESL